MLLADYTRVIALEWVRPRMQWGGGSGTETAAREEGKKYVRTYRIQIDTECEQRKNPSSFVRAHSSLSTQQPSSKLVSNSYMCEPASKWNTHTKYFQWIVVGVVCLSPTTVSSYMCVCVFFLNNNNTYKHTDSLEFYRETVAHSHESNWHKTIRIQCIKSKCTHFLDAESMEAMTVSVSCAADAFNVLNTNANASKRERERERNWLIPLIFAL